MKTLKIVVRGTPAPQGSKRFVGRAKCGRGILVESSAKVRPWRQDVRAAALEARGDAPSIAGPVNVSMVFTLAKPASAPRRRRTWPAKRPDLSKLVRAVEDGLVEAGVLRDDAQIVELLAVKAYPDEPWSDVLDTPGVVVRISEIRDDSPRAPSDPIHHQRPHAIVVVRKCTPVAPAAPVAPRKQVARVWRDRTPPCPLTLTRAYHPMNPSRRLPHGRLEGKRCTRYPVD
jgi:Holliday junction resolvase RusA-like endonuclease